MAWYFRCSSSTVLSASPRIYCVGGRWDRTQDCSWNQHGMSELIDTRLFTSRPQYDVEPRVCAILFTNWHVDLILGWDTMLGNLWLRSLSPASDLQLDRVRILYFSCRLGWLVTAINYMFHVKIRLLWRKVWPGSVSGSAWIPIGFAPWIRIEAKSWIKLRSETKADP